MGSENEMQRESNDNRVLIAFLARECVGLKIYGIQEGSKWSFWSGNSSDQGRTEQLENLVPFFWPMVYPISIHPEFIDWFRDRNKIALSELGVTEQNWSLKNIGLHWLRVFRKDGSDNPFEHMLRSNDQQA